LSFHVVLLCLAIFPIAAFLSSVAELGLLQPVGLRLIKLRRCDVCTLQAATAAGRRQSSLVYHSVDLRFTCILIPHRH